ncbi:hypothetical protein AOQ73_26820 [Bradyrhizobium pachyrhizi]|nr:hypothetical protein AOQ73_26820 [Bradyrhizobium pachyrhizi]
MSTSIATADRANPDVEVLIANCVGKGVLTEAEHDVELQRVPVKVRMQVQVRLNFLSPISTLVVLPSGRQCATVMTVRSPTIVLVQVNFPATRYFRVAGQFFVSCFAPPSI